MFFLNPNIEIEGYPAQIPDALMDFGPTTNTGLMGVSSFGSGGTNARADLWARCRRGANRTIGVTSCSMKQHAVETVLQT